MFNALQDIIAEVTGKTGISYDTDFIKDLQLNSFDIVSIISLLEERYKVKIPTRILWKFQTVRDLLAFLAERGLKT